MAVTIKQVETPPAAWPAPPPDLSPAAAALDPAMVWRRIEDWVAHRWAPRAVTWTVEGGGEWSPPLTPATVESADVWTINGGWLPVVLEPGPLGYVLAPGVHRLAATVGAGPVPPAGLEAYKRLAEYMAGERARPGATADRQEIGPINMSVEINPAWLAKALPWSGAADLLRHYRRA